MRSIDDPMLTGQYFADLYIAATQGGEGPVNFCDHREHGSCVADKQRCAICGDGLKAPECMQCGTSLDE